MRYYTAIHYSTKYSHLLDTSKKHVPKKESPPKQDATIFARGVINQPPTPWGEKQITQVPPPLKAADDQQVRGWMEFVC